MKITRTLLSFAVASALATIAGGVQASGFQLIEQNASGLGNAYAGQAAAAENASTIYYNPAGMTYLPGKQVSGAIHFIGPSVKFTDNGGSRSPAGQPAPAGGTNGGDAGDWTPTGNGYMSWQLSPQWWAGVGISVPFGLKTEYDTTFIGRYQSQNAQLKTYDINPSVAYKVSDTFSIGGGVSYQHADITLNRSFFAGAISPPEAVNLDDDAWGWNIGAMFTTGPKTRLGLSYRSTVKYDLSGSAAITGLGAASAMATLKMPDTFSAAISHQWDDKLQLLGDITLTRWSSIKNVPLVLTSPGLGAFPAGTTADTLDFQFRDSWRIGLGANYKWNQQFTLKLGTAYDQTPVPDALHRTVFLPDSDRYWLAIGGKYQMSKQAAFDFGYAHLFVNDGAAQRNKGVGAAGAQGIVSGNYQNDVNILSAQFTYSF
jgi:long-chain fatty acid transport protein